MQETDLVDKSINLQVSFFEVWLYVCVLLVCWLFFQVLDSCSKCWKLLTLEKFRIGSWTLLSCFAFRVHETEH